MVNLIITILTSIGGSAIIIGILQKLMINSFKEMHKHNNDKAIAEIQNSYNKQLKKLEHNYQREIENHKITLGNYSRYSDEQFKIYNDFWAALSDLKQKADTLWGRAETRNLIAFAKQLRETKEKVDKSRLLIEENHYLELKRILEIFSDFSIGKTNLMNLRNNVNETNPRTSQNEINNLIDSNEIVKNQYDSLVEDIYRLLRSQIYYSNPNTSE